jgi:hypothetical protein
LYDALPVPVHENGARDADGVCVRVVVDVAVVVLVAVLVLVMLLVAVLVLVMLLVAVLVLVMLLVLVVLGQLSAHVGPPQSTPSSSPSKRPVKTRHKLNDNHERTRER